MTGTLITGGAGFIGSNFVRHWRNRHADEPITVLDLLTYAGNPENLDGIADIDLVAADIGDTQLVENLLRDRQIDRIVHFAAESHVDRSIASPDAFIATNLVGTHSLLKAAHRVWLEEWRGEPHHFHHVSTDEVYGSLAPDAPAFAETHPYAPNSPYSATKAGSDHLVRAYHRTYGLTTTASHCSNNYGPYQFPEKLIPVLIVNCLEGRALPLFGDGGNVRDWLHVDDHCRGIELVLKSGRAGEAYNIGGGTELSNVAVAEQVCAAIDAIFAERPDLAVRYPEAPAAHGQPSAWLMTFVADRPGHDRRYAIDCSKARNELGYRPQRDFAAGIAETVDWYLANEAWWRPLLASAAYPAR